MDEAAFTLPRMEMGRSSILQAVGDPTLGLLGSIHRAWGEQEEEQEQEWEQEQEQKQEQEQNRGRSRGRNRNRSRSRNGSRNGRRSRNRSRSKSRRRSRNRGRNRSRQGLLQEMQGCSLSADGNALLQHGTAAWWHFGDIRAGGDHPPQAALPCLQQLSNPRDREMVSVW